MFTNQEIDFLLGIYEQNTSSVVSPSEFYSDIQKFDSIYKTLKSYERKGVINLRYVLNTFIILENIFGSVSIGMLIKKCPEEYLSILCSILEYTGRLPINFRHLVDESVLEDLRNL